jgi:hypothetical protein
MGGSPEDGGTCRLCAAPTRGMPSEPWRSFGPRTAEYVQNGRVWVCNKVECLAYFDALMDEDVADQRAGTDGVADPPQDAQDGAMTEDRDYLKDMGRMTGAVAHHLLHRALHDGVDLMERARGLVRRTASAVVTGAAGAVGGAVVGFLVSPDRKQEDRQTVLQRRVQLAQMGRTFAPMLEQQLTTMEYDARKELEHMGYYPCEECGVPHVKDEPHRMPPGTYWSAEEERYIRPDDPKWTRAGYEGATGDRWDLDDDQGSGQVH